MPTYKIAVMHFLAQRDFVENIHLAPLCYATPVENERKPSDTSTNLKNLVKIGPAYSEITCLDKTLAKRIVCRADMPSGLNESAQSNLKTGRVATLGPTPVIIPNGSSIGSAVLT